VGFSEHGTEPYFYKGREFHEYLSDYYFLKTDLIHGTTQFFFTIMTAESLHNESTLQHTTLIYCGKKDELIVCAVGRILLGSD
jgi:hypothetical protein